MLEAAASPAYKDLLDALGKLAQWTEEAGKGSLPSGPPPADLVRQFDQALNTASGEAMQNVDSVRPRQNVETPMPETDVIHPQNANVVETTPPDVIAVSDVFRQNGRTVRPANSEMAVNERVFGEQRRKVEDMTIEQKTNMEWGLEALEQAVHAPRANFFDTAHMLSQLLNRSVVEISPMDLLQTQRLVGILKVHAESGRKVSEGVSDTLEQLLEQQG